MWEVRRRIVSFVADLGELGRKHDLLPIAYLTCFASIFLTNSHQLPRWTFVWGVIVLAVLTALPFSKVVLTRSVVFWAAAAYLVALGLSTLLQPHATLKSVETHFRNAGFVLIFLMVTPYLTTLTVRMTNALVTAACLVAAISALVNMGAFVLNAPFPHDLSALAGYRLTAVVGMPDYRNSTNISATYAVYFMLATATAVSSPMSQRQRMLLFAAAAVLGAGVLFTQARSAMLAVVVGLSILIAAAPRLRLAIGGGLVAGLIVLLLVPGLRDAIMARGGSYRLELWAAFIELAWQKPLIGHGALANIDRVMADGYVVDQAHNLILSAQVRGGLVGAVAMATMLAGGIYWAFRHWRATGTIAPLAVVVTMTAAGMLDYQLLSTLPTWPWVTFWLPIGICIGAELATRGAVKASDVEGQHSRS